MKLDRFNDLWNRCAGFPDSTGTKVFHLLEDLYNTTNRFYHTTTHIDQCLNNMDEASAELETSDVVELSIWFHDAIYDPGAPDNGLRSAQYFSDLAVNRLPQEMITEVTQCILSTTHRLLPQDKNTKLLQLLIK